MKKYTQILKAVQLLSLVLFSEVLRESVCVESNPESQDISQSEYDEYYLGKEQEKAVHGTDSKLDEQKMTLMDVLWDFIETLWFTFLVIFVILITILCICLIIACDWTTICKPLEYCPCQSHSLLTKRFERLQTPGVYIRKNGKKDYYEPIVDESKIANDIYERLQNC